MEEGEAEGGSGSCNGEGGGWSSRVVHSGQSVIRRAAHVLCGCGDPPYPCPSRSGVSVGGHRMLMRARTSTSSTSHFTKMRFVNFSDSSVK